MGPVLHSAALPEPGGQGRPLLQGERIPTPVCALVRNDRVNFWGVIARALRGRGDLFTRRRGFYVSDGSLSFCGKRKGGKNAAKTKVLESFSRLGCRPRRSPLTSRTGMCKICTLLSYDLCGAIRWPLTRARAALTQQGYTLRLPCYAQHFLSSFRRGRCLHRPALPYSLPAVGRGNHTSPPGIAPQLMKNPVIARALRGRGNPFPPAPQKEVALRPPLNFCLHWRSLLLLQLAHQSNMQFVQLLLHSPQNGGAFCGVPSQDFNPQRK